MANIPESYWKQNQGPNEYSDKEIAVNVKKSISFIEMIKKDDKDKMCNFTFYFRDFDLSYAQVSSLQSELENRGMYSARNLKNNTLNVGWCTGFTDLINRFKSKLN